MNLRKTRLDSAVDAVDAIIGLTTVFHDYRVTHFVNQAIDLNLVRMPDLPVYSTRLKRLSNYAFYACYCKSLRTDFFLIANYNGEIRMIDQKQVDYLILIKGPAPADYYDDILLRLRRINQVHATRLQPQMLKGMNGIYHDLELHLLELKTDQAPG